MDPAYLKTYTGAHPPISKRKGTLLYNFCGFRLNLGKFTCPISETTCPTVSKVTKMDSAYLETYTGARPPISEGKWTLLCKFQHFCTLSKYSSSPIYSIASEMTSKTEAGFTI